MGIRTELAEYLDAELTGFTIYGYPPEVPDLPSIVFTPGDPYQVPRNFGKDGAPGTIGTQIDLTIAVIRTAIDQGFDLLESTRANVSAVLGGWVGTDGATARWSELGAIGTQDAAAVKILTGTIPIMIVSAGP